MKITTSKPVNLNTLKLCIEEHIYRDIIIQPLETKDTMVVEIYARTPNMRKMFELHYDIIDPNSWYPLSTGQEFHFRGNVDEKQLKTIKECVESKL